MWNKTSVTKLLGIEYPIIQGPFGGRFSSAKLTAKVSNLGGMGSFGLNAYEAEEILEINKQVLVLTNKPYALNLWVPLKNDPVKSFSQRDFTEVQKEFEPYFRKMDVAIPHDFSTRTKNFEHQVEALLKAAPPVASFIFGTPSKEVIQELKKRNIVTLAVATNVEEALAIEEAKVDIVVASGKEAGGHRAAFIEGSKHALLSTKSLVEKVKAQSKLPIIAAGGISTGNDICEMLRLGAGATQLGTAFLATQESNASQEHKNRLLSDKAYETRLTKVFTGRLARVISTDFVEETKEIKNLAPYPIQSSFLSALRKAGIEHDKTAFEAFWSGQPTTKLVFTTAESLFNSLVEEIETRLSL